MKVQLILLKRGKTSDFAIRLTDHGKRQYKFIQTPFTPKEWNYKKQQLLGAKPKSTIEERAQINENLKFITSTEKKYNNVIVELIRIGKPFTIDSVLELVDNPQKADVNLTLFNVFQMRVEHYINKDKYGTAETYKGTLNKLKSYFEHDMLFSELAANKAEKLMALKDSMNDLSNSSKSIHLRNIRAATNYAIDELDMNANDNPFKHKKVMQGLTTGYKSRAIKKNHVDKIRLLRKQLDVGSDLWHACNYFIVGYVGKGVNFADIARLQRSNIIDGRVYFVRHKTRSKVANETNFLITDELAEILRYYLKENRQLNNPYIFPILNGSHTLEVSIHNRIKKVRSEVNRSLKIIGERIESPIELTTYVWRHSFAATAKGMGVKTSMISQSLGHRDEKTTQHYLDQFPDEELDQALAGM